MNQLPPPVTPSPGPSRPFTRPTASARPGLFVYAVIITFALCLSALLNVVLFAAAFGKTNNQTGLSVQSLDFSEEQIGGDPEAHDKILVIGINGVIAAVGDGVSVPDSIVGLVQTQLKVALDDPRVRAIIVRINSPGGEVVASDMIYRAIRKADEVKPVVAAIDSVGASGGYYVAVGARHIVATEMAITGSIGVVMQTFSAANLAEKVGIKFHTFKSGKYKDLLNPARDPRPDEIALINDLVMEIYHNFVGIVAQERSLVVEDLTGGLADGRILSGRQAERAGFIDEVGQFEDAVAAAMEYAGVDEAQVVRYQAPFTFRDFIRIFGKHETPEIRLAVTPQRLNLRPGHFYFLPPYLFE